MSRLPWIKRLGATITAVTLATLGGAAMMERPAQAVPPGPYPVVSCTGGSVSINYSPGLTFAARKFQTTGKGSLGTCVSASKPNLTGATFTLTGDGDGGCPEGYNAVSQILVTWNTGEKSTLQGTFNVSVRKFILSGGTVVSGLFAGKTVNFSGEAVRLPWWGCLLPWGITKVKANLDYAEAR